MKIISILSKQIEKCKCIPPTYWLIYIANNFLIVMLLGLSHMLLHLLALEFEVYKGWSSWYWPIGVQVASYILMPFRYWLAIMLSILMGGVFLHLFSNFDGNILIHFNNMGYIPRQFSLIWLLQLPLIAYVKIKLPILTLERVKPMLFIMGAASSYRVVVVLRNILYEPYYRGVPEARLFEMILAQFLGGLLTILIIVPLCFLLKKAWTNRQNLPWRIIGEAALYFSLLIGATLFLYKVQPHTMYLMRIIAFIPLIWFSYKYSWEGAISALLVINGLIAAQVFGLNDTALLIESELYVISISITGIILGALMAEQKNTNISLLKNNDILDKKNSQLTNMIFKNQQLAIKMLHIQEEERKKVSHELHDEVGQNITALKLQLKLLEIQFNKTNSDLSFGKINNGADQVYESIYRVMTGLQPRALEDMGLKDTLSGTHFREVLTNAKIEYQCKLQGDINQLDDNYAIMVYRIVQECVNNCIRHAQAKHFLLLITVSEQCIRLNISDDGVGFHKKVNPSKLGGNGLRNIKGRVLDLLGNFESNLSQSGFELKISIPIAQTSNV